MSCLILAGTVQALPHATARLDGAQQVPPLAVAGTGTGAFRLNAARSELSFDLTVEGLTSAITIAHFHNAPAGANGGVVRTITADFSGNTASGVWRDTDPEPLTPELVAELLAGNIYVNVHTVNNGPGELRGQLHFAAGMHGTVELIGGRQVPPVATPATGTGAFTLTDAGLTFDLTVEGLQGAITAAHFHQGGFGVNGPPVRTITGDFTGNTASGIWTGGDAEPLTPALIADLLDQEIYLNVHTSAHGSGEIRDQVRLESSTGLSAGLDGAQEVPPLAVPGTGTASLVLNEIRTALEFDLTVEGLTSPITVAHFHNAPPGVSGPPVRTITADFSGNTASGVWRDTDPEPLTPALVNELLAGRIYLNVHTVTNGPGELRGQLRLTTGIGRTARLDGAQEVPPVATPATGTGSCVLTEQGVVFDATVEGLTSPITVAHFHNAPPGVGGPPVRTITSDFNGLTATGIWRPTDPEPLTPALVGSYLGGDLYFNIHTTMHGGGEVRGQLDSPVVVGIGSVSSPPRRSFLAQNFPNPFNPVTAIRYELASREQVTLRLFDVSGREVARLVDAVQAGPQSVTLDAQGLASGIYFYRLETPSFNATRKLVLAK
jgi:Cu/Zn superoxide dismutase